MKAHGIKNVETLWAKAEVNAGKIILNKNMDQYLKLKQMDENEIVTVVQ